MQKLWQIWSLLLIIVVGIYTVVVYRAILVPIILNTYGDQFIENFLLFIEICSFLSAIAIFYIKITIKRRELSSLFNKCCYLYKQCQFLRKTSSIKCLIYFLALKIISDNVSCFIIIYVLSKYFIIFDGRYISKILLFSFLFSVYCVICTAFYAINLFFVNVNYNLFDQIERIFCKLINLKEFSCNWEIITNEMTKLIQVHEMFMDLQRQCFKFFKPFIFLSITHLTFGFISEMTQIYLSIYRKEDYEAQIFGASSFLSLFVSQLFAHCHGTELLLESVRFMIEHIKPLRKNYIFFKF